MTVIKLDILNTVIKNWVTSSLSAYDVISNTYETHRPKL